MGEKLSVLTDRGYTSISEIGKGGFGKAILAKSSNGEKVVIKEVQLSPRQALYAKNEVAILRAMTHPYVVSYVDSFEDRGKLYTVMEYCEDGDLARQIENQRRQGVPFSEEKIIDWFVQICLALNHVHRKNVLHRDIKPENIFVARDGTLKLGDFGISKMLKRSEDYTTTVVGTPCYMPPEILNGVPYNNKCDIWCLGKVLQELMSLNDRASGNFSKDLQDLVKELLQHNPRKRPKIGEILEKPFLARRITMHLSREMIKEEFDEKFQKLLGVIPRRSETVFAKQNVDELVDAVKRSSSSLQSCYNENKQVLQAKIRKLDELTHSLEKLHKQTTIASLSGGVIGGAGGVTSVVGAILAPFTLGISLIVTGVGIGVAFLGGAASAGSNIRNMVKQKELFQKIAGILIEIQNMMDHLAENLGNLFVDINNLQGITDRLMPSSLDKIKAGAKVGKGAAGIAELVRLIQVVSIGKAAAQAARVGSAAGIAAGVLSLIFLLLDIAFIAQDAKEIHEIKKHERSVRSSDSEPLLSEQREKEIKSETLKFIIELKNIVTEFQKTLNDLDYITVELESVL